MKNPAEEETIDDKFDHRPDLDDNKLIEWYTGETPLELEIFHENIKVAGTEFIKAEGSGAISEQKIFYTKINEMHTLPSKYDDYTGPVLEAAELDPRCFPGKKVRVKKVDFNACDGSYVHLTLEKNEYSSYLSTNVTMNHEPEGKSKTLREWLHGKTRRLDTFEESDFGNHIGVVFMIETSDGKLVAQYRSKYVANRAHTISSSSSGTFELKDLDNYTGKSLIEAIQVGAKREQKHETFGLKNEEVFFLGGLRDYERGGLLDFYFYTKIDAPYKCIPANHMDLIEGKETIYFIEYDFDSAAVNSEPETQENFQERVHTILEHDNEVPQNLTFRAGVLLLTKHILKRHQH